jgi:hypothetical protein
VVTFCCIQQQEVSMFCLHTAGANISKQVAALSLTKLCR